MRTGLLVALALLTGLAAGAGLAIAQMRGGTMGGEPIGGPWTVGAKVGTAEAGLLTRATVALRGLLALPPSEARYLNATTDSAGAALDGRCRYRVKGGAVEARWWSLTVYDGEGRLLDVPADRHSLGSAALPEGGARGWQVALGPGARLPTLPGPFELTLRAYHPRGTLLAGTATPGLPVIEKRGCG